MSETSIVAIIGIGATLIGTIAGALITALVVGHHAQQDRLDLRRQAQLRSITNTIAALREWSLVQHANALFMSGLNSKEELKSYLAESVDSWTSTELIRLNRETSRALTESRVIVKDQKLIDALNLVDNLREHSTVKLHEIIEKSLRENGDKVARAVKVMIARDAFEVGMKELEAAARDLLAVKVSG